MVGICTIFDRDPIVLFTRDSTNCWLPKTHFSLNNILANLIPRTGALHLIGVGSGIEKIDVSVHQKLFFHYV
jgi:hypothetical protein